MGLKIIFTYFLLEIALVLLLFLLEITLVLLLVLLAIALVLLLFKRFNLKERPRVLFSFIFF